MILVDTSVWVDLLRRGSKTTLPMDDLARFVTCGPIVQEVLQGLREGPLTPDFEEAFLALPCVGDPLPLHTFLAAAGIYRQGRRRGFTIRSSVDCLIAALAIEHRLTVWHRDRDFTKISRYTTLEAVEAG
ncbi:MAG: PIN domain-containing protein [Acidobacteria bacterium]|nr:PIN domain-containing protein [Acidobacteriota bacterium]